MSDKAPIKGALKNDNNPCKINNLLLISLVYIVYAFKTKNIIGKSEENKN